MNANVCAAATNLTSHDDPACQAYQPQYTGRLDRFTRYMEITEVYDGISHRKCAVLQPELKKR